MKDRQKKFTYICQLPDRVTEKHNLPTSHLFRLDNEISNEGQGLHRFAIHAKVGEVWECGIEKFIRVK